MPLTAVPGPKRLMVLVAPVNVPAFTQLPDMLCVKLPPLNVVDAPILTFPLIVILEAAVKLTDVPVLIVLLKLPATVKSVPGMVFTAAPDEEENIKLP